MCAWTLQNKIDFIKSIYNDVSSVSQSSGINMQFILAQIALETGWGRSVIPGTNNIFNIKADSSWNGPTMTATVPEYIGGKWVMVESEFRVYDNYSQSIQDWLDFLQSNPRYANVFNPDVKGDLYAVARAIADAGYATDPDYFSKILGTAKGPTMRKALSQTGYFGDIISYSMFGGLSADSLMNSLRDLFTSAEVATPIILDLDRDGVETTNITDGAYFDHDKNGFAEQTGWASPDDGALVWDRNNDGIINDGGELFGNETVLQNGSLASNGFEALAEWDENADGKIDSNDTVWSQLKVWQDYDGDGYSAADELYTLDELGIQSINTGYTDSSYVDANGNEHRQVGSFTWSDETTSTATDVWFKTDKMYTIANEWLDVPTDIAALPDLQGYGNVYDLQQAMVRDTSGELKSLVEQFIAESDPEVRNSLMDQILFKWTGSDGIDPASRGPYFDARKLSVLEKFFGEDFVGLYGPDPVPNAAVPLLNQSYQGVFEMFYSGLMAQTHLKDLYDEITFTWDEATQSLRGNLSLVITDLQNRIAVDPVVGKVALSEFTRTLHGFGAESMVDYWGFRGTFAAQDEELAWTIDSVGKNIIYGTVDNDTISGTDENDAIRGDYGNDVLYGGNGDDALYGGAGDDVLDGGPGVDVLVGGAGNDVLGAGLYSADWGGAGNIYEGGSGNDTLCGTISGDLYEFNLGDGQDLIQEAGYMAGGTDVLRFGSGILPSDITVERSGYDLVFKHINGTDQVTVQSWYANDDARVEQVEFADGTVWSGVDVTTWGLVVNGTGGDDILYGLDGYGNTLYGLDGNDALYGYGGDDTLNGGAGNDSLVGGTGNDIYAFMRGDGQDTITDYDTTAGNSDKVKFGSGINPIDLILVNNGNNLDVQVYNSSDLVSIQNQNSGSANQVEVFEAGEGSQLLSSQVGLLIQAMADLSTQNSGMSWTELIQNKPSDVQQVLAQYWQPPQ
jgi:hypothetical protein